MDSGAGAFRCRRPPICLRAVGVGLPSERCRAGAAQREPGGGEGSRSRNPGGAGQSGSDHAKTAGRRRAAGAAGQMTGDLLLAADNLRAQKTRTLLTALGIVFGVGSVIGMLAIGAGAREESLKFIEQLGVRNILIDSRPTMSRDEFLQRRKSSQGLTDRDVRILRANIDAIEMVSPRKTLHP